MPSWTDPQLSESMSMLLGRLADTALARHFQVTVSDIQGRILYANPSFCQAVGYSLNELVGQNYRLLNSGLHAQGFFADMWQAIRSGGDWHGEIANRCKDGHVVWMDLTIFPLAGVQGQGPCYVGVSSDITRLVEMEGVLGQILQGDPVPTFVIDARHVVTHWNRALEVVTGVKAEQVVGGSRPGLAFYQKQRPVLADLIVEGRLEGLDSYYQGKYRRSAVIPDAYEAEGFFPQFGDSGRWLAFTAAPLRDAEGRIIGAIETLQDVTERKQAEEFLRQSQADLEVLVQRRTAQLAQAKAELEADIRQRQASEAELRQRNGELTELNQRLEEAQAQLVQSEKLASIGQLAAGVAHEINNPIGYVHSNLGTLQGYVSDLFELLQGYEVAVMALPEAHPARLAALELKKRKDLEFLQEDMPALMAESGDGISRVRQIVADLKDFSRVEPSQEWQWADLHQGLESTLNIVNNEIKYKADVVKEYGDLPEIECLPSQLNQVFMNLLVNAAHAMGPERGRITLRTGREDGNRVWVEVHDTGSGIKPEHLSRIFDPFFTTKPVGQGTGLGLSLSYGIIQKHGGDIQVRSQLGQGTTFRIVLPVRQTQEAHP
ncbi:PAS domain S-box protein [Azovibrio restrictus]|uniref:PAS domain S-box protein n=1 Tax=Azovibrio restrictus TaxID=146938 RepID=UPI0026EDDFE0|nr:PAS domain S-box protein [Azovibrio restrictus]MDD3484223.1 PAS domain S-box protein [Azovibrio restrictus]